MMGRKLVPRERTEIINLEEFVPQDHLLRASDRYLDLSEFRVDGVLYRLDTEIRRQRIRQTP
ncbi:hypothetical protein [Noviherbaspirillum sp.]|uniref:hypothetical protein n=1 Tax=Noviherbaspirillum sp. TaxID=1926288 RepID=UPI0039C9B45F